MKTIGIIGGMGPLATVDLYHRIVLRTKAATDQEHIHVIIDGNTDIPDRTKAIISDGKSPTEELIKSARKLEQAGADFLIMPCNTAHYYVDVIKQSVNIPFVNMLEETTKYTLNKYGKEAVIGILATDGTIKSKIYENYYAKVGIKTVIPEKTQEKIMKFIYDVIKKGNYEEGTALLFECLEELKEKKADAFLLGCTELSSAQYMYKFDGNFINPMEVLTEASILYAGGELN
ncbi:MULTISPECIES: aspartate/glutamate racemase family protein [unclassified Sedimentibacter]|uniref:aspartate/glutamate racemase family protein n=1 Tax=unclassified Sedimentibacter TaxID=2649220 RepID=UPI0027E1E0A0|nr:amino acid racemase [Sedimentibacter sp. MB35-C1]WMJ76477.1 amino acid racemase [Sedimentibacter sp. MB35-C1]